MEFIYECDDVFPVDFCNRVIDKFEKSNLKMTGCTGGDFVHPIKQSTDVRISVSYTHLTLPTKA